MVLCGEGDDIGFHFQVSQKTIQSLEKKNGWERVKKEEGFREEES